MEKEVSKREAIVMLLITGLIWLSGISVFLGYIIPFIDLS